MLLDVSQRQLLPPGVVAVGIFLLWTAKGGGYATTVWYPSALVFLALSCFAVLWRVNRYPRPAASIIAAGLLLGFTCWSFASIAWSTDRGIAWEGANRTLLYLTIYSLFALLPWTARTAASLLALYAVGVAVIGAVVFLQAAASGHPETFFLSARLAEPNGYQNGNCAAFMMAFWPAVVLGSRREIPPLLRTILVVCAGFMLELALLSQSRGWLVSMPIVAVAYVALVPNRLRSLLVLVAVAVPALLARHPLLAVYTGAREGDLHHALVDARRAMAVSIGVLALVWMLIAVADRRWTFPRHVARRLERALAVTAAVGAVASLVLLLAIGRPGSRLRDAWHEFSAVDRGGSAQSSSYLGRGLGSNRYDIWRVAALEFQRAPVTGAGADNFLIDYDRERRSREEPLYPHSLEARVLSQTGAVGALLFAGFLVAAFWRLRKRASSGFPRAVAAAALVSFAYWFVHGSVDWFWEIPALGGPALAWLALAAAVEVRPTSLETTSRAQTRLLGIAAGLLVGAAIAGSSYVFPWLSAKYTKNAAATWGVDPKGAFEDLARARRLNPLSSEPDMVAGAIAARTGDYRRMRLGFTRAAQRTPMNWYAQFELGLAESLLGRRSAALDRLKIAESLNPSEPTIREVARAVRRGRRVSPARVDRIFVHRLSSLGQY